MPYIDAEAAAELDAGLDPRTPGELNYAITQLILEYLPSNPRYSDYNSVVGTLESCKLEFYRRAVATYEDQKAFENGDIYQQ